MQVVGREGGAVVSAAWREMIYDRRILTGVIDSRTQEVTDMSKVGREKGQKVQHFINKQIIQNKTIGGDSQSPVLVRGKNPTCGAGRQQDRFVE
jgi:hypothetical protein